MQLVGWFHFKKKGLVAFPNFSPIDLTIPGDMVISYQLYEKTMHRILDFA